MENVQDHKSFLFITLPKTKTKIVRIFTVVGEFYTIAKRYMEIRPKNSKTNRFFLTYRTGKCVLQPLGINKVGSVPQEIAKFLKLENPHLYTGHAFRRSSATILVDAGGDITTLKRHGGWKSNTVAEAYIEESLTNKKAIGHRIECAIPSTAENSKRLRLDTNIIDASTTDNEEMHSFDNTLYPNPSESNIVSENDSAAIVILETPEIPETFIEQNTDENNKNTLNIKKQNHEWNKNVSSNANTDLNSPKNVQFNKNISSNANTDLNSLKNVQFINCNVTININNGNNNN